MSTTLTPSQQARSRCEITHLLPSLGTLLLSRPPTSSVLLERFKRKRCDECLRVVEDRPIQCDACREKTYCTPSCQARSWSKHHQVLCKVLPRIQHQLLSLQLEESERLDGLLLCKLAVEHFSPDGTSSTLSDTFLSLLPTPTPPVSALPALLSPFLPSHLTPAFLSSLLARFQRNNHVLSTPDLALEPFAHVVLAEISRAVNHSCAPTGAVACSWGEDGLVVGVRTLKSLEEGQELTISYLDPLTSPKTRQETLQKIYSFTCTCAICEPSSISSSPPALPQIPSNPPLPHRSTGPVPYPSVSYPGESSNVTRIPEKDIANLTRRFEDAHCEARWDEAARLGETVLTVYWLGYGPFWPLIGTHLLSLASISLNLSILRPLGDPTGLRHLARSSMFVDWAGVVLGVCWGDGKERAEAIGPIENALEGEWKEAGVVR